MDKTKFQDGLTQLNIPVSEFQIEQFCSFETLLLEWNKHINLTAITDEFDIMTKHFFDSLIPLSCFKFPNGAKVIDVGTGAGFPAIPLKIVREDLEITLLDSLNKRLKFLNEVISELNLNTAVCVHARAEELGHDVKFRERYDIAVSRAVAGMDVLAEFCLPYVKVGGVFIAMKSSDAVDEINSSLAVIENLGGIIEDEITQKIPQTDITRKIVIVRKRKNTHPRYPRKMSAIKAGKG